MLTDEQLIWTTKCWFSGRRNVSFDDVRVTVIERGKTNNDKGKLLVESPGRCEVIPMIEAFWFNLYEYYCSEKQ